MFVVFLYFRTNRCSKHVVFTSLPSVYLAAIFLVLRLSVCFFHSLAAGHHLHSLSCSETAVFFIQSPQKQINMATASTGTMLTFSRYNQNPNTSKGFSYTVFVQPMTEVFFLLPSLWWLFIHHCQVFCYQLDISENMSIFLQHFIAWKKKTWIDANVERCSRKYK